MSSQKQNQLSLTSQRCRQQIRSEYKLLEKGHFPNKLIELTEQFELDSKCEPIDQELIHYLVVGHIVKGDWLSVKHVAKRYLLNNIYDHITQLAAHGINEELTEFSTLYPKVVLKILEKSKNYVPIQNLQQILQKAKISFVLVVYAKYYVSLDVTTILKNTGCKQADITQLGYKVKQGYVEFGLKPSNKSTEATQQILLQKIKNLAMVAEKMSALE